MEWKKLITAKIGPVPVLYIGAVILVIAAILVTRSKLDESDAADSELTDADEAAATADEIATADYGFAATKGTVTVEQGSITTSAAVVDTNDLWIRRAAEYIGGQGTWSTNTVQGALQAYVDGNNLSYEQGRIRDAAIKQFGLPPETVSPGTTGKMPAARQGNPPLSHKVKGSLDNTYGEIAALYYPGKNRGDAIDRLQSANHGLGSSGPFSVGTRVGVPVWKNPKYFTAKAGYTSAAKIASAYSISQKDLHLLNEGLQFPVKVGTKVHVGWL
jgi:hypothetical protein